MSESFEEMRKGLENAETSTTSATVITEEALSAERENFNQALSKLQDEKHQLQEQINAMVNISNVFQLDFHSIPRFYSVAKMYTR